MTKCLFFNKITTIPCKLEAGWASKHSLSENHFQVFAPQKVYSASTVNMTHGIRANVYLVIKPINKLKRVRKMKENRHYSQIQWLILKIHPVTVGALVVKKQIWFRIRWKHGLENGFMMYLFIICILKNFRKSNKPALLSSCLGVLSGC